MLQAITTRLRRLQLPGLRSEWVTLFTALFLLLFCNVPFWHHLLAVHPLTLANGIGLAAAFGSLLAVFNLILTLLAWPWLLRPLLTALLLVTAVVAYFMNQYGVMIDVGMVRNAVQTDLREAGDLLTVKLAVYVLVLGVLPAWVLWQVPIRWRAPAREIGAKLAVAVLSVAVTAAVAVGYYQTFASIARNHRELRFLLTPLNYVQATSSYVKRRSAKPERMSPWGTDARLDASWSRRPRKALTVLVIGETARADHFSLNGYGRDTNPLLGKEAGLVSFDNVWSCGTETAVSLPCMFSGYRRADFSVDKARQREGLLDVLQRAGLQVEWRDNQSGCKGVCDRVTHSATPPAGAPAVCGPDGCLDEALLDGLPQRLAHLDRSTVLVLHMMGSHGPAYFHRYPAGSEAFGPACKTAQLDQCTQQQIIDAYDNSLRYTDSVLARLIDILRAQSDHVDTAMIYVSDHGESLGEHGLYLHATPYLVAPDVQKHVPLLMWFSQGFQSDFGVDVDCLSRSRRAPYSHDNLFHSMLGLMEVRTQVYDPALDMFADCRKRG